MCFEHTYINAMHSSLKGYKTITVWTYYPGMHRVIWVAYMEAGKDSEVLVLSFCLFSEVLTTVKKQDGYKINAYGIIGDENGANLSTIEQVSVRSFLLKLLLPSGISKNLQSGNCLKLMWQKEKLRLHSAVHFAMLTQAVNIREYLKVFRRLSKGTTVY